MTQRYQAFAGPMLMLIADNGVAITLSSGQNAWVIGRLDPVSNSLPDVDLTPVDPEYTSSRRHAQLSLNGDQAYLTSLTRTNWTKVNGQRLIADQPTPIQSGDRLEFGKVAVTFRQ